MTVIIGVRCADGVVIGADSMATSSMGPQRLIQLLSDDKIEIISGKVIIASTGSVGLAQRFHAIVKDAWDVKKLFQKPCLECSKEITKFVLQDFQNSGVQKNPNTGLAFGSLMAAPLDGVGQLVEFGVLDFQPEIKRGRMHFVSLGSGQILADPFLAFISRVLWGGSAPDVKTAVMGVYWVLLHTIQYAPGGVGHPIRLATLTKEGKDWVARSLDEQQLQESAQHIAEIEKRIGNYPRDIIEKATVVDLPKPPQQEGPNA